MEYLLDRIATIEKFSEKERGEDGGVVERSLNRLNLAWRQLKTIDISSEKFKGVQWEYVIIGIFQNLSGHISY